MNRKEYITKLRSEKKTYQEISNILGISKQRIHQIYKDYETLNTSYKNQIKERDGNKCSTCDSKKNLEIHHIHGKQAGDMPDNLITLCRICHAKTEGEDHKTIRPKEIYSGKKLSFQEKIDKLLNDSYRTIKIITLLKENLNVVEVANSLNVDKAIVRYYFNMLSDI